MKIEPGILVRVLPKKSDRPLDMIINNNIVGNIYRVASASDRYDCSWILEGTPRICKRVVHFHEKNLEPINPDDTPSEYSYDELIDQCNKELVTIDV